MLFEFRAPLLGAEGMEASLSSGMHPGIDGISAYSIFSSDLGNLTAGPDFLDDGELDFWRGMIFRHLGTNKNIKKRGCQEKSVE